jgi:hypothetical protein
VRKREAPRVKEQELTWVSGEICLGPQMKLKSFLDVREDCVPEEGGGRGLGVKDSSVPLFP